MDVAAVVVVQRRTGAADALTEVGGVAMVALAVRALLDTGLVDHVCLHDLRGRPDALERACAGLPVSVGHGRSSGAHSGERAGTTNGDGAATFCSEPGDVILLHDAARPLAPPALARAVVAAVQHGHDMAVPVLPLSDTVKHVDGGGLVIATPDRSGLRVLQTPVAARAEVLAGQPVADPLEHVRRCLDGGARVHTVPGDPAAFAVHGVWDLELARLLAERTIAT